MASRKIQPSKVKDAPPAGQYPNLSIERAALQEEARIHEVLLPTQKRFEEMERRTFQRILEGDDVEGMLCNHDLEMRPAVDHARKRGVDGFCRGYLELRIQGRSRWEAIAELLPSPEESCLLFCSLVREVGLRLDKELAEGRPYGWRLMLPSDFLKESLGDSRIAQRAFASVCDARKGEGGIRRMVQQKRLQPLRDAEKALEQYLDGHNSGNTKLFHAILGIPNAPFAPRIHSALEAIRRELADLTHFEGGKPKPSLRPGLAALILELHVRDALGGRVRKGQEDAVSMAVYRALCESQEAVEALGINKRESYLRDQKHDVLEGLRQEGAMPADSLKWRLLLDRWGNCETTAVLTVFSCYSRWLKKILAQDRRRLSRVQP